MKLVNSKGTKTALWLANELATAEDMNFLSESSYENLTDLLSLIALGLSSSTADTVMSGMLLEWSSVLTCNLRSGTAISHTGRYFNSGVWGFTASAGEPFAVFIGADQSLAFDSGSVSDRYDTLQVRPVQNTYDSKTRSFRDPVTESITSAVMNTKIEYGFEFQILKGTPGAGVAPTHTAGWIKVAEVFVPASASAINQSNIKDVRSSSTWTAEASATVMILSNSENHFSGIGVDQMLRDLGRKLSLENTLIDELALNVTDVDATTISASAEVIEANDLALISTLGRAPEPFPYPKQVYLEPAYMGSIDMTTVQSPWGTPTPRNKWQGRAVIGCVYGQVNLCTDPEAPSSGWTDNATVHTTAVIDPVLQTPMTKVAKSSASAGAYIYFGVTAGSLTLSNPSVHVILKLGTAGTQPRFELYDSTGSASRFAASVNFATHSVTFPTGSGYVEWLDSTTVRIYGRATGVVSGNANRLLVYPDNSAAGNVGDFVYVTKVLVSNTSLYAPYTATARPWSLLRYLYPMTAAGTVSFWYRPVGYGGATVPATNTLFAITEINKTGATWSSRNSLFLRWTAANQMQLSLVDNIGATPINTLDNTWTLSSDTWYYVTVTWSGLGTASGAVTVYLNGSAKANLTFSGLSTTNVVVSSMNKLFIGSDGAENDGGYSVNIANSLFTDILVDSVAWSPAQIVAHYNVNKPFRPSKRMVGPNMAFKLDQFGNMLVKRLFTESGDAASVVETGSNANGRYVKWSDGTLVCYGQSSALTTTTASGSVFYSPTGAIVFPVSFFSAPIIDLSVGLISGVPWTGWWQSLTAIGMSVGIVSSGNGAQGTVHYTAIGRWKTVGG